VSLCVFRDASASSLGRGVSRCVPTQESARFSFRANLVIWPNGSGLPRSWEGALEEESADIDDDARGHPPPTHRIGGYDSGTPACAAARLCDGPQSPIHQHDHHLPAGCSAQAVASRVPVNPDNSEIDPPGPAGCPKAPHFFQQESLAITYYCISFQITSLSLSHTVVRPYLKAVVRE